MIRFIDGPAEGQRLMLRRAPFLLRVTSTPAGKWDALNNLEDTPRADETLYAYQMTGEPSWCHVRMSRGRGGFYTIAQYRHIPDVFDDDMRTNDRWREWCIERAKTLDMTVPPIEGAT